MIWDTKSFHIELTNTCVAQCPFCIRTKIWVKKHMELSKENIYIFFNSSLLEQIQSITLCWTWGDPIYAKDFLDIVEFFRSHGIFVIISTNGYNKKKGFWNRLWRTWAHITFWIDGITQESHSRYRVWTELKQVLKNAKEFIDAGWYARWQFLVFWNNEHQIKRAKILSESLGFKDFILRTSREYSPELPAPLTKFETIWEKISSKSFFCKYKNTKQLYISASGQMLPCCYLADTEFKDESLLDPKMNIKESTFPEIQKRGTWIKNIGNFFDGAWWNICVNSCPSKWFNKEKLIKN